MREKITKKNKSKSIRFLWILFYFQFLQWLEDVLGLKNKIIEVYVFGLFSSQEKVEKWIIKS
jgi:hypothetical protein